MPKKVLWKPVPEFEDVYEVSSKGKIRNKKTGRLLKSSISSSGREHVILCKKTTDSDNQIKIIKKSMLVHRLVAIVYVPNPHNLKNVKHLKKLSNNEYQNLEWCSDKDRKPRKLIGYTLVESLCSNKKCKNKFLHQKGTKYKYCSKKCYSSDEELNKQRRERKFVRVVQLTLLGKKIKVWNSAQEIADFYKCSPCQISNCLSGYDKSARGFKWQRFKPRTQKSWATGASVR